MYETHSEFGEFDPIDFEFMCKVIKDSVGECKIELFYASHIRQYNGGVPLRSYVPTATEGHRGLARFHHYSHEYEKDGWQDIVSCVWTQSIEYAGMDRRLWPIGGFFNGDELCFDFRVRSSQPPVVIWCHEDLDEFDEPLIIPVCESFESLLSIMKERDPD